MTNWVTGLLLSMSVSVCFAQYALPKNCTASNEEFTCEKVGRFADLSDTNCQRYFLCSPLHNGTILKTPYECEGASFDPDMKKCSDEYVCPCSLTTKSSTITTTTTTTTTERPSQCHISNEEFTCEVWGRFADLSDPECKRYFLCSKLHNGTLMKTPYKCMGSAAFDPKMSKCSSEYLCPCDATTSSPKPVTTTTAEITTATPGCKIPENGTDFVCKKDGRFADLRDTTCTKYFLCTKLRNGTFIKTPYVCQKSSFNPLLGKCVSKFYCPCSESHTTTSEVATSTTEGFTKLTTSAPPTTTSGYQCKDASLNILEFQCNAVGRYPDYNDNTCRRYYLCSQLRNGTFMRTPYQCPASSCINSSMQRCSSECICPCLTSRIEGIGNYLM